MFIILVNEPLGRRYTCYNLKHKGEIIMMVSEFRENITFNEVSKISSIIKKGEQEARRHVPYLKRLLGMAAESLER
jgi:hypothetical protein